MEIDYFTIIAQIVNFLILIFLLKHFLYGRVIKAMDEREQEIASRFNEVEQSKEAARKEADSYLEMKQRLSDERQEKVAKVEDEVQILRTNLIKKTHDEIEKSRAEWYESVEREKEALISDFGQQAGKMIYAIARRALQDLANDELEHQIIINFINRLQNMTELEKKAIRDFYLNTGKQIIVRTAFEIPNELQHRIQDLVRVQAGMGVEVKFQTAKELISGIDMSAQNVRIGWNLVAYLDTLEADLSQKIEEMIAEKKAS